MGGSSATSISPSGGTDSDAGISGRHYLSSVIIAGVFLLFTSVSAPPVLSGVPQLLNLQGRLTDKQGVPLTGEYKVKFSLWDSVQGGGSVWSEFQTVRAERGIFQVLLGAVQPMPAEVFTGSPHRYLEIDIDSPLNDPPMSPRQRLVTVAYAFLADEAVHSKVSDHAKTSDRATHSDTSVLSQHALTADTAATAQTAISAGTAQTVIDGAITLPKLADEVLDKFVTVSTQPETQGHIVLPSTSPVITSKEDAPITIDAGKGEVIVKSKTIMDGDLHIGRDTVYITTETQRIGIGTTSPQTDLHIQKSEPRIRLYDLNSNSSIDILWKSYNFSLMRWNGGPDYEIFRIGPPWYTYEFSAFNPCISTRGQEPLRIQAAGGSTGMNITGSEIQLFGYYDLKLGTTEQFLYIDAGLKNKADLCLNTLGKGETIIGRPGTTTYFMGDISIGGNRDIYEKYGVKRITLGPTTTIHGNLAVTGSISALLFDAGTLGGHTSSYFLDTSSTIQTKSGGLNLATGSGGVGIGTNSPTEKLDVVGNARISGNVGIGTTSPAQKLDVNGNLTVSGKIKEYNNDLLPRGVIVMWSGTLASIPAGWALCDGKSYTAPNGDSVTTPDLRNRFILSSSAGENPGGIGGSHSITLSTSQLPAHTHTGTTAGAGGHSHTLDLKGVGRFGGGEGTWGSGASQSTSAIGDHSHAFTTASTGSGSLIDIRPSYYKLAFIMKL